MLKDGTHVTGEIRKLDGLTKIITDNMNAMAHEAVQINNAVQEVNAITQQNKDTIESLSAEVGKFKVYIGARPTGIIRVESLVPSH